MADTKRTTLIGNALYRVYKYLGYNTTGINHLGDYGTQFGKMIEAYKMWGNEYNLKLKVFHRYNQRFFQYSTNFSFYV